MNHDICMNDTFDNITLSGLEECIPHDTVQLTKITDKQKSYAQTRKNDTTDGTTSRKTPSFEVSFDDSQFFNVVEDIFKENEKIGITEPVCASGNSGSKIMCVVTAGSKDLNDTSTVLNIPLEQSVIKKMCNSVDKIRYTKPENSLVNCLPERSVKYNTSQINVKGECNISVPSDFTSAASKLSIPNKTPKQDKIPQAKINHSSKKIVVNQENLNDTTSTAKNEIYSLHVETKPQEKIGTQVDVVETYNKIEYKNPEVYNLSFWGLPKAVLEKYESRSIKKMFPWQVECLKNASVLSKLANLVYSAPTSAGKTLVAEILAIKTLCERQKKVIVILPFVSIVREKMYYFQDILGSSGIRVEGFMGSYNPPGGFQSVQLAICTIEKANNLINKLLEEGNLSEVGAVLVDEIHLLGDPSRGYLLELLLTKLKYITLKNESVKIQVIGMSATLPNLQDLATWLNAQLYTTTFRPIPLHEQALVNGEIYDNSLKCVRKLQPLPELGLDTDNILQLCLETIKESSSVLIFCPTKNWCENLAQQVALAFCKLGKSNFPYGQLLRDQLKSESILELLEQLKYCPVGLDEILRKTVSFAVGFHHAGLTMDERDIIEGAFRNGTVRVLVATSTLSSGVNLPARRVIIRTPMFHGKPIDALVYRQMIGRAGRMGKDTLGESFLICQKNDYSLAKSLMSAELQPVESCLESPGKLKRAILEIIASGIASTPEDVKLFTNCTLLAVLNAVNENFVCPIEEAIKFLQDYEFIRLQCKENGEQHFIPTSLGKACLSSSIAPDEGLALFTELEKARQCFVLETELHLIYLVTPYSACNSWGNIDWMFYLELWEKLSSCMKRVGELVGIKDSFMVNAARGRIDTSTTKLYHRFLVHKRFFVALALQDLVNEVPLGEVCSKFSCNRGMLQSLQQSASSFAGMVTAFCRQLGWGSVEILLSQFQDRMQFGVSRDLLDLMKLSILNGKMARTLFNAGIESVIQLANSDVHTIENILYKAIPFESLKEREGESEHDTKKRNKFRTVWITGKEGLTELEAAEMLVTNARNYLKIEVGLVEAKWTKDSTAVEEINNIQDKRAEEDNLSTTHPETNQSIMRTLRNLDGSESHPTSNEILISHGPQYVNLDQDISKTNPKDSTLDSSISSLDLNISSDSSLFSENSITECVAQKNFNYSIKNSAPLDVQARPSTSSSDFSVSSISLNISQCKESLSNLVLGSANGNVVQPYENATNMLNRTRIMPKRCHKEVSLLLMSPSPVELNISDSSVFSHSHDNLSASIENVASGDSLLEGDFTSATDKEKTERKSFGDLKTHNIYEGSKHSINNFYNTTYCKGDNKSHNSDDEILFSSTDEENVPEIATTRLKRRLTRHSVSHLDASPSKKKKISTKQTDNPLSTDAFDVEFSSINIIHVCKSELLLKTFEKEIRQQSSFALSLACSMAEESRPLIGINVLNSNEKLAVGNGYQNTFVYRKRKLNGFALSWGVNNVYYLSLDNLELAHKVITTLKTILRTKKVSVVIFDSKEQTKYLKECCGIDVLCKVDDPKIADWIMNSEDRERNLPAMTVAYCPKSRNIAKMIGNYNGTGSVGLDLFSSIDPKIRSSVEAILSWHIMDSLACTLKKNYSIYEVEMKTVLLLAKIEIAGICVKKDSLQKLVDTLKNLLNATEKKAYALAGRRFNFISSSDVAKVLGSYKGKKVSVNKQVLERTEHPISDLVLQWRKLNFILTKTIYPLIREVENERIHGCHVTHTATGRISMQEPNLQNVAKDFQVKNPLTGLTTNISCRSAFSSPESHNLISADYCQLELRILAHLSQDTLLCNVIKSSDDVFKSIAAKWNKVSEDMVDDEMRQNTKHICYGIIYGIGSKSLAQQLGTSEEEAATFMENFRNTYPKIKSFVSETIEHCKENGYVKTITGRKRYLPNINNIDSTLKSQAERQAVNTRVQGSAADIVKRAMLSIDEDLQKIFFRTKNKPKLILHLHDELIYEVPEKYLRKVARAMKKCMENVLKLCVPLPVKLKTGQSWGELMEYEL